MRAIDVRAGSVRRSRVVRAPRCWRLSPGEAKLLAGDGGKRAVLREEHEVSRKAIAQGRPECSRCPVCSCAVLFAQIARETAGAASTRSSLRPLISKRANEDANLGRSRREIAKLYHRRWRATIHRTRGYRCAHRVRGSSQTPMGERSETHHRMRVSVALMGIASLHPSYRQMDCFASLAMTL